MTLPRVSESDELLRVEPGFPRVSETERKAGLARLEANVSSGSGGILIILGVGVLALGAAAFNADHLYRPWFTGGAIASGLFGLLIWRVASGPFAKAHARKVEALPWGTGISFLSPGTGLVYAGPSTLMLETGVFREPPRFSALRYSKEAHALELEEAVPESDGSYGTIILALPQAMSAEQGAAIAAQLDAWWR